MKALVVDRRKAVDVQLWVSVGERSIYPWGKSTVSESYDCQEKSKPLGFLYCSG